MIRGAFRSALDCTQLIEKEKFLNYSSQYYFQYSAITVGFPFQSRSEVEKLSSK
jgi:hypothetical protein